MTIFVFDNPPAVFIRVRKTGTTSLIQGIFGTKETARVKSQDRFRRQWRKRFVFAFVRNPFDRLVSCYEMFRSYKTDNDADTALRDGLTLGQLIDLAGDDSLPLGGKSYIGKLRQHAIPACHPSYHIHEATFIGRFETYDQDYQKVREHLGLAPAPQVPHARATGTRNYRDYFDADTRRAAEAFLAEDLDRFGYHF